MDPFIGEIKIFGGSFAPRGWNFCDGSLLSVSGNEALFSLIGTTYGGDGVVNFAVPDLRSRVPIHRGQGSGLHNYAVGTQGGLESVTLQPQQLPQHLHTVYATTTAADPGLTIKGNLLGAASQVSMYTLGAASRGMGSNALLASTASGKAHENRMPSIALNYIIALVGIFPSRMEA